MDADCLDASQIVFSAAFGVAIMFVSWCYRSKYNEACAKENFEAHVRRVQKRRKEICVLDVAPKHIYNLAQGNFGLVEEDLRMVLGKDAEPILSRLDVIREAYTLRRELVNYKKAALLLFDDSQRVVTGLKRLVAFFYVKNDAADGFYDVNFEDGAFHRCSTLLQRALGLSNALLDARKFTKNICCLPRFPHAAHTMTPRLTQLPRSLSSLGAVASAEEFLRRIGKAEFAEVNREEFHLDADMFWRRLHEVLGMLPEGLPDHVVNFVRCVLIARGAFKASNIGIATKVYLKALQVSNGRCRRALRLLREVRPENNSELNKYRGVKFSLGDEDHRQIGVVVGRAVKINRYINKLTVLEKANANLIAMLETIVKPPKDQTRLLVAGDLEYGSGTMFLPAEFSEIGKMLREYAKEMRLCEDQMLEVIKEEGWPPPAKRARVDFSKGKKPRMKCVHCGEQFAKFWGNEGCCWQCQRRIRDRGECPFESSTKRVHYFCPHQRKCVVCEGGGFSVCPECNIGTGDGEAILNMCESGAVKTLFLDFDRTLCSTKRGGSPLRGKHSLDMDLASAVALVPRAYIVTRNPHKEEIEQFLQAHGVEVTEVCVTPKKVSKATTIKLLMEDGICIFADDDLRECMDPEMKKVSGLTRILFRRCLM